MNTTAVATLIIAGVAVVSAVGSVLLLAYRIGRLIGATEARIALSENDRAHLWEKYGALSNKVDRHIERGRH